MQPEHPDTPADVHIEPPLVVQAVKTLLVIGAMVFAFGVVTNTHHLLEGINVGEDGRALLRDVWAVVHSLVLLGASGVAFLAMRGRRAIGRWIAVGLIAYLQLRSMTAHLYALRAASGELSAPAGLLQYSSPQEAKGALAAAVVTFVFFAALALHLAFSRHVTEYFKPNPSPRLTTLK